MRATARAQSTRSLTATGGRCCAPHRVHVARPQHVAPTQQRQRRAVAVRGTADDTLTADVVIVGAGIVGLFAAADLLKAGLSVALLERRGLCAGATGAGQGYLWMAHRNPGSVGWALAARSVALWQRQVESDPAFREAIEWQDCGSLLVATSPTEAAALSERQMHLNEVGVRASYMDGRRLADAEPGLALPPGGAALLVQADTQINGRKAAHILLDKCRASPDFTDVMGEGGEVQGLELAAGPGAGHVVRTKGGRVRARHALVLAAGVWTGGLLAAATAEPQWQALLQPRRGHLLELPQPAGMPRVAHGIMEMSYTKHYAQAAAGGAKAAASGPNHDEEVDITFTATTSASGTLLVGSSREFSGWDVTPSPAVVSAIMQRAALFLPGLQPAAAQAAAAAAPGSSSGGVPGLSVRVGLRPYAVGGLPLVGPVAGAPGLFVAAGHEGSGLCMGPATGQLLSRHVRKHVGASSTAAGAGGGPPAAAPTAAAAAAAAAAKKGKGAAVDSLDTASFNDLLPDVRRKAAFADAARK
ncbi:hypothetical protein HYH02_009601 [Chlamydomonas schloesseri]|uniref:FAD-dependent oxidoreductase domain-containing protein 1 n=1 Tax=Chlamydomonas schloesseri TaxID=2026947 RepID=A0A835TE98_9CHLO|nr:hypothetical protein HYH02_009601 [Chlamydomonas schloesseri]|eukprot:KAG2442112.1 hypothetical protein HYH02_009601 [Chlamydomonas schloesseri]